MTDDAERFSPQNSEEKPRPYLAPPHLVRDNDQREPGVAREAPADVVYQLMANSIPQLVWRTDADGRIDYLSDQWYDFTGVSRPHSQRPISLHEDWQSVIHPDDLPAFLALWSRSVNSAKRFEAECRIHRADEGYCWHLCRANPVRDGFGRILSWHGTSTCVNEQRQEHDDLVVASIAKDRFLAMLAHELRTPLTPALLILDELEAGVPIHLRHIVQILRRNIEREAQLVGDVFDVSAARNGKLLLRCEVADMRDIVTEALEVCRPELDAKDITATLVWQAQSTTIVADPARLQQVMWNLLRNAAKFTPAGGKVEIGAADASGNLLRIWVKDNGIGIAPEALARVFIPFEQAEASTASRFGGLGLGLAIARNIAELHQGNVFAQSDGLGCGSTFVLEIPVLSGARIPPAPTDVAPQPTIAAPAPLAILLVEDHPDTAHAMHRLLRSFGHEVTCAQTAADALACALAGVFDLVISDVRLPDQSGWEFVRSLRTFSEVPAIAITGLGSQDDIAKSRAAGFTDHLVKPVSVAALRASISTNVLHLGAKMPAGSFPKSPIPAPIRSMPPSSPAR